MIVEGGDHDLPEQDHLRSNILEHDFSIAEGHDHILVF